MRDARNQPGSHTGRDTELVTALIAHPGAAERATLGAALDSDERIRVVAGAGAGDSDAAMTLTRQLRPSVVLLDDRVTAPGDRELVRTLARWSQVIILTAATECPAITALLRDPVRGCLVYGQFEAADLRGAVRAVAAGLGWLSPVAVAAASWQLRGGRRTTAATLTNCGDPRGPAGHG
ncbi:hypothetical protein SAMN05443287_103619 [Micromonospora phaseoli]|uniref:Response regulator receiver domain-containing protein n=1 Tax=Micromonospora phaseoli TaxID=1144548 RepID=A0A1H6XFW6_9ACTN|nr:response regulator transcription factor [Micromonospora phaseoli]PZW02243.1 hypothetical protein CLV64_102617 [Micromonospora phaseoli]SEJ28021.1 hypothetical protein SAMN05443287_103619 [Micromonospora phaseoli]